jgi:hypothetical protein
MNRATKPTPKFAWIGAALYFLTIAMIIAYLFDRAAELPR